MPAIEVIAIGSELLNGFSTNTNAAFIGRELLKEGFRVNRQTVIRDEFETILTTFKETLERSSIVIVTGGLGPTLDDITKQAAADFFHSDFRFDKTVAEDLKKRFGDIATLVNQSTVPVKAKVLLNEVGTAPGFIFEENGSVLILMPGVPKEMEPMLSKLIIPYLKKITREDKKIHFKKLFLYGLYEADVDPSLRELKTKHPFIDFGIYPAEGKLTVVLSGEKPLDHCFDELAEKFQKHLLDFESGKIEEAIHEILRNNNRHLSMAESCTGGKISAKLTSLSGASDYFLGSIICYSNFMKMKYLSVSESLLKEKGAVSAECVQEMASALLDLNGTDFSLAVSGIAGPSGGSQEKPVGTIFGAVGFKGVGGKEIETFHFKLSGNRAYIIESASNRMLFELYKLIKRCAK